MAILWNIQAGAVNVTVDNLRSVIGDITLHLTHMAEGNMAGRRNLRARLLHSGNSGAGEVVF